MISIIIIYSIGYIIAALLVFRKYASTYFRLTLNDAIVIFIAGLMSWFTVLVHTLVWLIENGNKIIIFNFRK